MQQLAEIVHLTRYVSLLIGLSATGLISPLLYVTHLLTKLAEPEFNVKASMNPDVIPRKRIALIAHDGRKERLINWVTQHRDVLSQHDLVATGTTGDKVEEVLEKSVRKLLSGPEGGDQQIGALIAEGQVDVLVFFWDPMAAQPHDPDVKALLRIGVLYDIAMASNETTANLLITGLLTSPHLVE